MIELTRRDFIKTSALVTTGLTLGIGMRNQFNIVVRNGLVVDGTGAVPINADVGIVGDRIAAIGNLSNVSSDVVIDATNLVVSPGFIDIHTHTDTSLLINPKAESKIRQGVTTELSGNCGSSPFPMNDEDFKEFDKNFFERTGKHITWRDIGGFFKALEESELSINYATLTGHGDLRSFVIDKNDVQPNPEQLKDMCRILKETLEQGSFGLSTGLEYAPGSYAQTLELIELSKTVAQLNGIYATHMRDEGERLIEAVDEALTIGRDAKVSVQISHLKTCNKPYWNKIDTVLENIQKANEAGIQVRADRYPYIAYSTGLSAFLPLWSRQGTNDEILARLTKNGDAVKIAEYAQSRSESIGGWDRILISNCHTDEGKQWEGKTILDGIDQTGLAPFEFIRALLLQERLRVSIVGFAMSEDNLKKFLSYPLMMIGSDGNAIAPYGLLGEGKPHPRSYGTFARVLGKYCREEQLFDIATAVRKMTSMPAQKIGLKQRGVIQKNYFADITIFNPDTVIDNATYINPHQYASGIEYVIVSGKIAILKGEHTGTTAGIVLRRG